MSWQWPLFKQRTFRQRIWLAGFAVSLGLLPGNHAWAADAPIVTAIEAVYLTKFSPFIEWPPSADPSTICVLNDDKIADEATQAESKAVGTISLPIRRIVFGDVAGCQILFIGAATDIRMAKAALAATEAEPILTVTDRAADGAKGIINFVIWNDRVRFEVDEPGADRRQLRISSKLLSVAVSVKP
jgi:hypothetical protein